MNYLYHGVPGDMQGNVLYPLNVLKEMYPGLYDVKAKKYVGREQIMEYQIPILNCLWNDVLHFAAIHPKELKETLVEAGMKNFNMSFYQVDPAQIDSKNAVVFLYSSNEKTDKDFIPYNIDDVKNLSTLPEVTKSYYKEIFDKGGKPLMYHRVPHVLYKGSIDVSNLPIITV